ncbi:MAG TPA: ferredoxin family protein [Xanthobacteraceae bacterium]|nr:ferredoxin family protein [Xanthobacteraceae bacterium]
MIELVSEERCITCNKCVQICPMNVFDAIEDAIPVIARKQDCQTCFMCELYCPTDALYVAPDADSTAFVDEQALVAGGLLGSYRRRGWAVPSGAHRSTDQSFRLRSPE